MKKGHWLRGHPLCQWIEMSLLFSPEPAYHFIKNVKKLFDFSPVNFMMLIHQNMEYFLFSCSIATFAVAKYLRMKRGNDMNPVGMGFAWTVNGHRWDQTEVIGPLCTVTFFIERSPAALCYGNDPIHLAGLSVETSYPWQPFQLSPFAWTSRTRKLRYLHVFIAIQI